MTFDIKPNPDFSRLENVLRRKDNPERAVIFELYSNIEDEVLEVLDIEAPRGSYEELGREDFLKRHIKYNYAVGYDFINVWCRDGMTFPIETEEIVGDDGVKRRFDTSRTSVIDTEEDFEKYSWPDMANGDYSLLDQAKEWTPDGMRIVTGYPGILQTVSELLGYEAMCIKIFEEPELVKVVFEAVGSRIVKHLEICAQHPDVGIVQLGDDLGFATQTLFSPDLYREMLFPWYKKATKLIHDAGKLSFLHSCGKRDEIMTDLVDCGWDAIHSFEDKIQPVWEFKKEWGDKLGILGGFDMHKIETFTEAEVRAHTRCLIEKCGTKGFALGTGNSVAPAVPVENFLAMVDETFKEWK